MRTCFYPSEYKHEGHESWFEPTFHKHAGKLCHGVQIHVEDGTYQHHEFRPWRLQ